jgi:hypothetical protein
MVRRTEAVGWALVGGVLVAFAVPWFLWGSGQIAFGLPLWLWWHIGWMGLAAMTFRTFTHRAWGVGVETGPVDAGSGSTDASTNIDASTDADTDTEPAEPKASVRAEAGGEH